MPASRAENSSKRTTLNLVMVQQALAVFLVLTLLLGALWLLRRKGLANFTLPELPFSKQAAGAKRIRVLERVSLTPQHSVHLVQVIDTVLVIGVSPAGCCSLASLPATAPQTLSNVTGAAL